MPWLLGKLTTIKNRLFNKDGDRPEPASPPPPPPPPPVDKSMRRTTKNDQSARMTVTLQRKTVDASTKSQTRSVSKSMSRSVSRTLPLAETMPPTQATQPTASATTPSTTTETTVEVGNNSTRSAVNSTRSTVSTVDPEKSLSSRRRKAKSFVSRPIKERTMQKVIEKVQKRAAAHMPSRPLGQGEDAFPEEAFKTSHLHVAKAGSIEQSSASSKSKKKLRGDGRLSPRRSRRPPTRKIETLFADPAAIKPHDPVKSCYQQLSQPYAPTITPNPSEKSERVVKLVTGNKNNDGELFVDGQPWWQKKRKPDQDDLDDVTFDDLQMSADVVLEVSDGRVVLKEMPTKKISLDPYLELLFIMERDEDFFCRDVLFGNTVRTMCNTFGSSTVDGSLSVKKGKSVKQQSKKSRSREKAGRKRAGPAIKWNLPNKKDIKTYRRKNK